MVSFFVQADRTVRFGVSNPDPFQASLVEIFEGICGLENRALHSIY